MSLPSLTVNINGAAVALDVKAAPLWWHLRGLSYTASGYGRRIPSRYMVRVPGSARWRRVYCYIFSNAGTYYIEDRRNPRADGRPGWLVVA